MRTGKLLFAAALPVAALAEELYRYLFCRNPGTLSPLLDKKGHEPDYYDHRDGEAAAMLKRPYTRHSIYSADGHELKGFYYPNPNGFSGKIAFIVHGYRSEHRETAGMYYIYYMSRGFSLFCCDNTAAGESEGMLIGYDWFESRDCLRWLGYLTDYFGKNISVVLHGFSMGAATALKMSDRLPDCVKFIVADSGYTSAQEILKRSLGRLYQPMRLVNRLVAGYDTARTDVRENLRHCDRPVLFVHGRQDATVPIQMAQELYELCPAPKDKLFVDDARHVECMHRAPELYQEKLNEFINRYINRS